MTFSRAEPRGRAAIGANAKPYSALLAYFEHAGFCHVQAGMIFLRHKLQVLYAIVQSVSIDVVNMLIGSEGTTYVLLHNKSVLQDSIVTTPNPAVSIAVNRTLSPGLMAAKPRAKTPFSYAISARVHKKLCATKQTSSGELRSTTIVQTFSRAKSTAARLTAMFTNAIGEVRLGLHLDRLLHRLIEVPCLGLIPTAPGLSRASIVAQNHVFHGVSKGSKP